LNEKDENAEEHELEKIKLRKMQAIMEAQKIRESSQQKQVSVAEKINYVLQIVLAPDAYQYLNKLKSEEPRVFQGIYNELISPDVIQNIDLLLSIIQRQGGVPRRIPLDAIIYLERQVKGIKSKIKVKKGDGEMMDLGAYLKK
jgi:DNA-binding TFAR19-related protein (PDSD5 family)